MTVLESVNTSPKTPAHLRITLHRLWSIGAASFLGIFEEDSTMDAAVVAGEVVYATGADTLDLADASAVASSVVAGIALDAGGIGDSPRIQACGVVEIPGWGLTPGARYFLSLVAGAITTTAPISVGEVVVDLGVALSTTKLRLLPAPPILL